MQRRGNVIRPLDSVNTIREMLVATDATVEDGETVYVRSTQGFYVYRIGSALVPDGVNVIASLYGNPPGAWQLLNTAPAATSGIFVPAEARFVDKGGNDTTGDGSPNKPFLTVQRAITSITTASAGTPFAVEVGAGIFAEAFLLQPWIFIVGTHRTVTTLSPPAGNLLGAGFAGGGVLETGISNVTMGANFTVDFAAVGSTGSGKFYLNDFELGTGCVAYSFIGNNTTNRSSTANGSQQLPAILRVMTVTNIVHRQEACDSTNISLFVNCSSTYNVTFTTDTYQGAINLTETSVASFATFTAVAVVTVNPVLVGNRVSWNVSHAIQSLSLGAVNLDLAFTSNTAPPVGAMRLLSGARIVLLASGGVGPFTWNFASTPAPASGTLIDIINAGGGPMTLLGMPTPTVLESGASNRWISSGGIIRSAGSKVKAGGLVTLVNGVSPFIPADLTGNLSSSTGPAIAVSYVQPLGTIGKLVTLQADRVANAQSLGGGFIIRSVNDTNTAFQILDQSIVSWSVVGFA